VCEKVSSSGLGRGIKGVVFWGKKNEKMQRTGARKKQIRFVCIRMYICVGTYTHIYLSIYTRFNIQ
jgi:hypothetical protein